MMHSISKRCCAVVSICTLIVIVVVYWSTKKKTKRKRSKEMGQRPSTGFIVEIAPTSKLTRGWQSLPTTDDGHESDDDDSADEQQQLTKSSSLNGIIKSSSTLEPWRIIVNPVAEQHQLSIGSFGRTRSLTTFDTNDCSKRQYVVNQSIGQNRRLMDRSGFSGDQYRQMILNTVDQLYGKNKVLSVSEAQSIALALDMKELSSDFMLRLLTVIANSAAFTVNQDLLRHIGVVRTLISLLEVKSLTVSCRVMLMQSVANMAVNAGNQLMFKPSVLPIIVRRLANDASPELERAICIQALTNLSVTIAHDEVTLFAKAIPCCLRRIWSRGRINLDVLRLLVNLCCCPDLVPPFLAARSVPGLLTLFDATTQPIEVLLRSVTLLLCICSTIETLGIEYNSHIAPLNVDPFGSELHTVYFALFGAITIDDLIRRVALLCQHDNDEIAHKCRRIAKLLDEQSMMIVVSREKNTDGKCTTAPSLKRL